MIDDIAAGLKEAAERVQRTMPGHGVMLNAAYVLAILADREALKKEMATLRSKLREPTDEMLAAAAGALKAHIDALPPDVRAKSKETGGVVFVGPLEKHAIRFRAMIDAALAQGKSPVGEKK